MQKLWGVSRVGQARKLCDNRRVQPTTSTLLLFFWKYCIVLACQDWGYITEVFRAKRNWSAPRVEGGLNPPNVPCGVYNVIYIKSTLSALKICRLANFSGFGNSRRPNLNDSTKQSIRLHLSRKNVAKWMEFKFQLWFNVIEYFAISHYIKR